LKGKTMTATETHEAKTVIFCTKTAHAIDMLRPGQNPQSRIAELSADYGPALVLLTAAEALERSEAPFITDPEEISAERFGDMLNILPPMSWKTDSDGESFKMCEFTCGRITAIFVRIGERYATFSDRASTPHRECCRRAYEYFKANPG